MKWLERAGALARTPLGRVVVGALGVLAALWMLERADPARVWASVQRGGGAVPLVFALEGAYNVLELLALRRLYGEARARIPTTELFRAGIVAYAFGGVMPMGRPVVESVRGIALAQWTSGARAAAAGTRLSILLLLSQAALSVACALASLALEAPLVLTLALVANGVLTLGMGGGLYLAARGGAITSRLPRLSARAAALAPALDQHLRSEPLPSAAVGLVVIGRLVQVAQYTLLLRAFVGSLDLLRGLGIVGIQMVGATLGDLVPTHLGATELFAPVGASTLSLALSDALAIPLIVHAQQMVWIALGFVVYALGRSRASG